MKHLDLFSGVGGFSLAASWVWEDHDPILFCETNDYCCRVLKKNWPNVRIHNDIKTLDATRFQSVDLVTGGFPCQPYSLAGRRRGRKDDRALWPEMLRVIDECRPRWILAENVDGFTSMVEFDSHPSMEGKGAAIGEVGDEHHRVGRGVANEAMGTLESLGYDVEAVVLPACAVDAKHQRYRVWIVGHAESGRWNESPAEGGGWRVHEVDWRIRWRRRCILRRQRRTRTGEPTRGIEE